VLHQLQPKSAFYNIPVVLHLHGALNIDRFERSLRALVERHEALRTALAFDDGRLNQHILSSETIPIDYVALSNDTWLRWVENLSQTPFDLSAGAPLARIAVGMISAEHHVLVACMHHAIADGASVWAMLRQLAETYRRDGVPAWQATALRFADHARWERRMVDLGGFDTSIDIWRARLDATPVLTLPTDHPRPAALTYRGALEPVVIDRALTQALKTLGHQHGVTLQMTLLSVFAVQLLSLIHI